LVGRGRRKKKIGEETTVGKGVQILTPPKLDTRTEATPQHRPRAPRGKLGRVRGGRQKVKGNKASFDLVGNLSKREQPRRGARCP